MLGECICERVYKFRKRVTLSEERKSIQKTTGIQRDVGIDLWMREKERERERDSYTHTHTSHIHMIPVPHKNYS